MDEVLQEYAAELFAALTVKATPKKHANVLQHVFGYFKKELSSNEKKECVDLIEAYRKETLPLIVPVTLLNHFVNKYDKEYLAEQIYMHPHPLELKLRNQV